MLVCFGSIIATYPSDKPLFLAIGPFKRCIISMRSFVLVDGLVQVESATRSKHSALADADSHRR